MFWAARASWNKKKHIFVGVCESLDAWSNFKVWKKWKKPDQTLLTGNIYTFKGIFSDFNKIILWHKSTDIKKKRLFPKFQLILIFRLQVMHDYVH